MTNLLFLITLLKIHSTMKKKVSPDVKSIITQSRKEALRLGHDYIGTEHLLLGIIQEADSFTVEVLISLELDIEELRETIDDNAARGKMGTTHLELGELPLNRHAEKALKTMSLEARILKHEQVCPEHLLLAILKYPESVGAKVLNGFNVDYDGYKQIVKYAYHEAQRAATQDSDEYDDDEEDMRGGGFGSGSSRQHDTKPKSLAVDTYGRDVSASVKNRLYPTIERETEIQLTAQLLSKKEKNNVLLVGEPGIPSMQDVIIGSLNWTGQNS